MRKTCTYFILAVLFAAMLSACSKKTLFGHFTSNPENKPSFAGKELTLNEDGSFIMNTWTDSYTIETDENGEVICNEVKSKGHGTYTAQEGGLSLKFTNREYLIVFIDAEEKSDADSSWYELNLEFIDEVGKPFDTPRMHVLDADGNIIKFIFCHTKPYQVRVRKDGQAHALSVSMFGSKDFVYTLEEHGEGRHKFQVNRCRSYYAEGTELRLPYKMTRKGIVYTNEQGREIELYRSVGNF